MLGTLFGTVHSRTDLNLIQQKCDVQPCTPKTNYKDIPGANGSKDLTEALGVGVRYADRTITWTFGLFPGTNWATKRAEVASALNGRRVHIVMDDDTSNYWDGRLTVSSYKKDGKLKQIIVKAVCHPIKWAVDETVISRTDLTTSYKTLPLTGSKAPVVPVITVSKETTLSYGTATITLSAGTHTVPDIVIGEVPAALKAKLTSGTGGSITVTYRKGSL